MLIDFIKASGIFSGKDTPFFGNLQFKKEINDRFFYSTTGALRRPIEIIYHPESGMMTFKGSVMYFTRGHNFTFNRSEFNEGINYIGQLLQIGKKIWDMQIDEIECGVIIEVDKPPKEYIKHHREGKGMNMIIDHANKNNFRGFDDPFAFRKVYDAGRNIQLKQSIKGQRKLIEKEGWDKDTNYFKFEVHYKKPHLLNNGVALLLHDIVTDKWDDIFSSDVIDQYNLLHKMKQIIPPSDKSDFHVQDILAIELVENMIMEGMTLDEVRKSLYNRINASDILSKTDKDARKASIRKLFQKMTLEKKSSWDLSDQIKSALK